MNKTSQIIIRIICIIGIIVSFFIIFSFVVNKKKIPGIYKYMPVVVKTNTSISNINKGDLLIIKNIDSNKYKKGDVIVFRKNNKNILSEIVNIKDSIFNLRNNIKIDKYSIQGIEKIRIPLIGYFIIILQSIIGFAITTILIIISIVWYKLKTTTSKDIYCCEKR